MGKKTKMKDKYQFGDYDPFEQPDTMSIWRFVWPSCLVLLIFILSFVGLAYLQDFNAWLDATFDKSDQQRTGIVLLIAGCTTFAIAFLVKCVRR